MSDDPSAELREARAAVVADKGLSGAALREALTSVADDWLTQQLAGVADVAISLPDGGSRIIRFRAGKPDGSDSSEPMHFTREGSLNMIRIGKAERFEILDALALGN